jgi:hypothetical protein
MAGALASVPAWADQPQSVGDLPTHVGDDGGGQLVGEEGEGQFVGDWGDQYVGDLPGRAPRLTSVPESSPVPAFSEGGYELGSADAQFEPPVLWHAGSGCDAASCDDAGCRGGCGGRMSRIGETLDRCQTRWAEVDFLLWFPRERRSPILAGSAPQGTVLPFTTEFGNGIDSGLAPGIRFDAGHYFADGQFGVGGRFWTLFEEEEDFQTPNGGPPAGLTPANARNFVVPFQNIAPPPFDTAFGLQISRDPTTPGPGPIQGNLNIDTDLRVLGSELYGKLLIGKGSQFRLEMLGGYSYFNIRDRLALNARVVPGAGNPGFGTETSFSDYFAAENNFHGAQIGVQSKVRQGRWSFTSTNKVHFGNVEQTVAIDGSSQTGPFNGAPALVDANRGLFAEDTNFSRDTFTFAPEVNFKLAYQMRQHVHFTVGYSLVYWDSVALAGEQIDPVVDARRIENLALTDQEPEYVFQDAAFFVQGIDLGVTAEY